VHDQFTHGIERICNQKAPINLDNQGGRQLISDNQPHEVLNTINNAPQKIIEYIIIISHITV